MLLLYVNDIHLVLVELQRTTFVITRLASASQRIILAAILLNGLLVARLGTLRGHVIELIAIPASDSTIVASLLTTFVIVVRTSL